MFSSKLDKDCLSTGFGEIRSWGFRLDAVYIMHMEPNGNNFVCRSCTRASSLLKRKKKEFGNNTVSENLAVTTHNQAGSTPAPMRLMINIMANHFDVDSVHMLCRLIYRSCPGRKGIMCVGERGMSASRGYCSISDESKRHIEVLLGLILIRNGT